MVSKKTLGGVVFLIVIAAVVGLWFTGHLPPMYFGQMQVPAGQVPAPAPAEPTITIGALTDLTSYTAEYGQQERAGLEVLVEQVNAGKYRTIDEKISLKVQDTKASPKDAIAGLNQLFSVQPVPSIVFSAVSSMSLAILPLTQQKQVLTLVNATAPEVLKVGSDNLGNATFRKSV